MALADRLARLRSEAAPSGAGTPPAASPVAHPGGALGARCATCGEPVGRAMRRNREWAAVEPGTTEPHRCVLRVVTAPIGPPAVIETAEGVVIRGYRVPADYQPRGSNEVVFVGREVRPVERRTEETDDAR